VTTRFAATVLYVRDPAASIEFYARAFGLRRRHLNEHENGAYAELETGDTLVGFVRDLDGVLVEIASSPG
jgi:lactoylglutathione lyase